MGNKSETEAAAKGHKVPDFVTEAADDDAVRQASEGSFPASDPPSHTPVSHPGKPKRQPPPRRH